MAAEGLAARLVLGMLVAAGILYANIGPVIVSGLAAGATFSAESAGYIFSANLYGNALGGFLAILFVARIRWRPVALVLLTCVGLVDLASVWVDGASTLVAIRFGHGLASGALLGVAASVVARATSPERTFAISIGIQLLLGGLGVAVLGPHVGEMGVSIVWFSLVGFSVVVLLLTTLLDDYPITSASRNADGSARRAAWLPVTLALAALFLYQAGEMATFAYVIEIGSQHLLDIEFMSLALAVSLWIGGPAALLVTWWSTRSGRRLPLCLGIFCTAGSIALLLRGGEMSFFIANAGFGVFFSLTIPYLFGLAAEMDNSGRMAAVAGFANSLGLATGPAIAAMLVAGGDFNRVVMFSIVMLMASAAVVWKPAGLLDGLNKHGRVAW